MTGKEEGLLLHPSPCKVVCLVGSTKPQWKQRYRQVEEELTKAGYAVFTVVWFRGQLPNFEKHRSLLETIHFQKIRSSDAVVLIHKDAKGKHTSMEMEFARRINRPVIVFGTIKQTTDELSKVDRAYIQVVSQIQETLDYYTKICEKLKKEKKWSKSDAHHFMMYGKIVYELRQVLALLVSPSTPTSGGKKE